VIKFYSLKARHALHALHSLTLRPCLDDVRLETTRGGTGVPESTRQDFLRFCVSAFSVYRQDSAFIFRTRTGVKNLGKTGPGSGVTFQFRQ